MARLWCCLSILALLLLGSGCTTDDRLALQPVGYEALPGWTADHQDEALQAFRRSCQVIKPASPQTLRVDRTAWQYACVAAEKLAAPTRREARQFFEQHFTPMRMRSTQGGTPLLTGYYIPLLPASLSRTESYRWPAYSMPPECKDKPCYHRKEIDEGALDGRELELLWFDDPITLFFAQIQGSAVVELPDGSRQMLRYAGHNGQSYYPVGRWLIEQGEVPREAMSLHAIDGWMRAHPQAQQALMQRNPRYIFFQLAPLEKGAVGAQGVALTPWRSLAVDATSLPYGLPVYAALQGNETLRHFNKTLMTQDTGSAIVGPLRGDVFFGFGTQAEQDASAWQQSGALYVLLPKDPD